MEERWKVNESRLPELIQVLSEQDTLLELTQVKILFNISKPNRTMLVFSLLSRSVLNFQSKYCWKAQNHCYFWNIHKYGCFVIPSNLPSPILSSFVFCFVVVCVFLFILLQLHIILMYIAVLSSCFVVVCLLIY